MRLARASLAFVIAATPSTCSRSVVLLREASSFGVEKLEPAQGGFSRIRGSRDFSQVLNLRRSTAWQSPEGKDAYKKLVQIGFVDTPFKGS